MESMGIPDDAKLSEEEVPTLKHTWAIGGGKGGVGKSLFTIGLAHWLGRLKRQVVLMDADLGGANLHTMLGMRIPKATLDDFLLRRVDTLEEILLPTVLPNVQLIAGGSEVPALANPNYGQKSRILRSLDRLSTEYLLVDLGAGASLNTLDFFLFSPEKIVVMTPQPTSIQNAYAFIKAALYRKIGRHLRNTPLKGYLEVTSNDQPMPQSVDEILEEVTIAAPEVLEDVRGAVEDLRIRLVVNMVRHPKEQKVGDLIGEVCQRFLGVQVETLGVVPYDPSIEKWALTMDSESLGRGSAGGAFHAIYEIAYGLLDGSPSLRRSGTLG